MSNPLAPNLHWQQNKNCCSFKFSRFCWPPEPAVPLRLSQNVTLSHQHINGVKSPLLAAIFISETVKFALCHVMPMLWQQHRQQQQPQALLGSPFTYRVSYSDCLINVPMVSVWRRKLLLKVSQYAKLTSPIIRALPPLCMLFAKAITITAATLPFLFTR